MPKRYRLRWLVAALSGLILSAAPGCARRSAPPADWPASSEPGHPLAGYEGYFWITWNGARIGDARESLRQRDDELRFERRERLSMRRGDALVHGETAITIVTDRDLVAREISIWQISGDSVARGRAHRDERGVWVVSYDGEPTRRLPADAVPAELVPLLIASQEPTSTPGSSERVFDGPVILSGYGFATGRLTVETGDDRSLVADLQTPHGVLRGRYLLQRNGTVARVIGADGVSAVRVASRELAMPFDPPELVDSTSLPVRWADRTPAEATEAGKATEATEAAGADEEGARSATAGPNRPIRPGGFDARDPRDPRDPLEPLDHGRVALVVSPVSRPLPPPLPGQRVEVRNAGWYVTLYRGDAAPGPTPDAASAQWPADATLAALADRIVTDHGAHGARAEIVALARATADLIEDDLSSGARSSHAALALGRGDCTAHATLFASLARARGIPVRLVTGYRLDGDRLVRHRWAIASHGGRWIAVDPTHGEAPAGPRLLGLAVHDGGPADMAVADDMAFSGLTGATALRLR